jgi:hypothetical protein
VLVNVVSVSARAIVGVSDSDSLGSLLKSPL